MNKLERLMEIKANEKEHCFAIIGMAASLTFFLHSSPSLATEAEEAKATKTARLVTVRIEGATQGSGVIVDKNGNYYR